MRLGNIISDQDLNSFVVKLRDLYATKMRPSFQVLFARKISVKSWETIYGPYFVQMHIAVTIKSSHIERDFIAFSRSAF